MPPARRRFVADVPSQHTVPTLAYGPPCGAGTGGGVEACGFDGAGAALQHLFAGALRNASGGPAAYDNASLFAFDQVWWCGDDDGERRVWLCGFGARWREGAMACPSRTDAMMLDDAR